MPLLCLAVGVAAAIEQTRLVAPVASVNEQPRLQLHDVVVGVGLAARHLHTALQLQLVNHLAAVLHHKVAWGGARGVGKAGRGVRAAPGCMWGQVVAGWGMQDNSSCMHNPGAGLSWEGAGARQGLGGGVDGG
jgi:hypothetical protein